MRAVVVAGPRRLAVEQVPDPTPECALPLLSCGRCARCLGGLGAYGSAQRALGFGQVPGAYAERVRFFEPAALITDHIGLDAVPAAFAALERPTDQCKVLVLPGS